MTFKKITISFFCFLSPIFFFGQIKISENIQVSTVAKQNDNSLYFVDFWATWCKPCIHVSKYLESLQKQYPNNFYILSLTKENPDVVKRFMEKHDMGLAVAIDFEGDTFKNNNISSLPFGILYNAYGTKLWEGHPADFKAHYVESFLKKNNKQISVKKMFEIQVYKTEEAEKEIIPKEDFEILKLDSEIDNLLQVKHETYLELKGSLQDILAYSLKVYMGQIQIPANLNGHYKMSFKYGTNSYGNMALKILEALGLQRTISKNEGEAIVFNINEPTFWNTQQINWGTDTENFLIGDSEIQADNVTLNQITYQLAAVLEMPIVVVGDYEENGELHDWQIHYKYFELMVSNLYDNYGINAEKKRISYPKYMITKKAP